MRMRMSAYPGGASSALVVIALTMILAIVVSAADAAVLDPGPPSIDGVSVSHITSKRATLEATINPDQLGTTYELWVSYSNCQHLPPGFGECDSITVSKIGGGEIAAGESPQPVSAEIEQLQPEYNYEYWVVASNSLGEVKSERQSFQTLPAPSIDSESVSGMTPNPITLEAMIDPNGQAVYYQFQLVGEPSEYAPELECPQSMTGPLSICVGAHVPGALSIGYLPADHSSQSVSLDLGAAGIDLKVGSTYHYRVLAAPAVQTEDTIEWDGPPVLGADGAFTVGEDTVAPVTGKGPLGSGGSEESRQPGGSGSDGQSPSRGDTHGGKHRFRHRKRHVKHKHRHKHRRSRAAKHKHHGKR